MSALWGALGQRTKSYSCRQSMALLNVTPVPLWALLTGSYSLLQEDVSRAWHRPPALPPVLHPHLVAPLATALPLHPHLLQATEDASAVARWEECELLEALFCDVLAVLQSLVASIQET